MERLFSYGTLQQVNVQMSNFGRVLSGEKAVLTGYIVGEVKITDAKVVALSGKEYHPILRATDNPNDEVFGTCYWLSEKELVQADSYEVAEYTRVKSYTKEGNACWVYAATADINATIRV